MRQIAKIITQSITGASAAAILVAGKAMGLSAREGAEAARAEGMPEELIGEGGAFTQITNTVLYAVGIISVIMLIFGGIRYITSGGDSKKVTDAKNTVLYAIIGLIISILAFAIVNFVLNTISAPAEG